jgi:hypothetical protein
MRWVPTWDDGRRWHLESPTGDIEGRIVKFSYKPGTVDAASFGEDHDEASFRTMKEAAQWLVKKVTTGTGAL